MASWAGVALALALAALLLPMAPVPVAAAQLALLPLSASPALFLSLALLSSLAALFQLRLRSHSAAPATERRRQQSAAEKGDGAASDEQLDWLSGVRAVCWLLAALAGELHSAASSLLLRLGSIRLPLISIAYFFCAASACSAAAVPVEWSVAAVLVAQLALCVLLPHPLATALCGLMLLPATLISSALPVLFARALATLRPLMSVLLVLRFRLSAAAGLLALSALLSSLATDCLSTLRALLCLHTLLLLYLQQFALVSAAQRRSHFFLFSVRRSSEAGGPLPKALAICRLCGRSVCQDQMHEQNCRGKQSSAAALLPMVELLTRSFRADAAGRALRCHIAPPNSERSMALTLHFPADRSYRLNLIRMNRHWAVCISAADSADQPLEMSGEVLLTPGRAESQRNGSTVGSADSADSSSSSSTERIALSGRYLLLQLQLNYHCYVADDFTEMRRVNFVDSLEELVQSTLQFHQPLPQQLLPALPHADYHQPLYHYTYWRSAAAVRVSAGQLAALAEALNACAAQNQLNFTPQSGFPRRNFYVGTNCVLFCVRVLQALGGDVWQLRGFLLDSLVNRPLQSGRLLREWAFLFNFLLSDLICTVQRALYRALHGRLASPRSD